MPFACVLRPKPFLARNVKWFIDARNNASLMTWLASHSCFSHRLFNFGQRNLPPVTLSPNLVCSWFKSHKRCAYGPGSGMCVPYQPHAWHPMISESWWRIWLHSISNFTQFHLRNSPTHSSTAPEKEVCKEKFWLQTVFSIIWHKYEVESCWCLPHY